MRKDISGQVVIVTGASSGIGRETALHFAREKARVALAARREQQLQALEKEIQELGAEVLSLATDVAQRDQVEAMVQRVPEPFGRVDILVNNAGSGLFALVEETTPEDVEAILQVNFFWAFYGIRAVLPIFRRHGSGHIINVASIVGKRGIPLYGAYCASKFALVGLSESLRLELEGSGIAVSLICPVGTATAVFRRCQKPPGTKTSSQTTGPDFRHCGKSHHPLRQIPPPGGDCLSPGQAHGGPECPLPPTGRFHDTKYGLPERVGERVSHFVLCVWLFGGRPIGRPGIFPIQEVGLEWGKIELLTRPVNEQVDIRLRMILKLAIDPLHRIFDPLFHRARLRRG